MFVQSCVCVNLYVCTVMCLCEFVCLYRHVSVSICLFVQSCVCVNLYVCTVMCLCEFVFVCTVMCLCEFVCLYSHVFVWICMFVQSCVCVNLSVCTVMCLCQFVCLYSHVFVCACSWKILVWPFPLSWRVWTCVQIPSLYWWRWFMPWVESGLWPSDLMRLGNSPSCWDFQTFTRWHPRGSLFFLNAKENRTLIKLCCFRDACTVNELYDYMDPQDGRSEILGQGHHKKNSVCKMGYHGKVILTHQVFIKCSLTWKGASASECYMKEQFAGSGMKWV